MLWFLPRRGINGNSGWNSGLPLKLSISVRYLLGQFAIAYMGGFGGHNAVAIPISNDLHERITRFQENHNDPH